MTPLEPVQSVAQGRADVDHRQQHALDALQLLLTAAEVGRHLFRVGASQAHKLAKRGRFDAFKVRSVIGPRCYSKVLIVRALDGQPVYVPTFGRRRA